ncbi:unnamed protein product [Mytilus coruscus]|uniref:Uncharacterized protein n=1 Tax=Mytilus coruscus TaxID=42192 RepID=A0A6J8A3V5_MYTCO|nr:unnamed protein product [Mytilus coruscus]
MNVINGLNLSSANCHKSVELLINRFGKTHTIVNAYMQALLDSPAPSYTLDSLRNFSDWIGIFRTVPRYLWFPITVKSNITIENGNDDWTLGNLRKAIQREISIQEDSTNRGELYVIPTSSKSFDPLDILSPVTVKANILMQSLWKRNFRWDKCLPEDVTTQWTTLSTDLKDTKSIEMSRLLNTDGLSP